MHKLVVSTLLAFVANTAALAALPWQDEPLAQSPDYCMGLVVGGLASSKLAGMSRSELWQAWSYLIRGGALDNLTTSKDYQSGLALFQDATDATSADAVLQHAMGSCGLGRSGHQITGW
ncbi:MAG: hypothetical protein HRT77_03260 [Halioglobus sp.]|nr:hypothetical protein [Halioglobus sp.]